MKRMSLGLAALFCLVFTFVGYKAMHWGSFALSSDTNLLFDSNRSGNYEIYNLNSSGQVVQLTNDATYDSWWPKPSPDGKSLIFYRTPKGIHDTDYTKTSLWKSNNDGSNVHELIPNGANGWVYQAHGEWSPDGNHLVVTGGPSGQIYITDTEGRNPVQVNVTGQTIGLSDPSYSPDGGTIIYAYQKHIWVVSVNGGQPTQLTNDAYQDYDPYFSPDGSQIAFLTHTSTNVGADWGIRLMTNNGGNLHWLINDGNVNSKPNWALDSSKIYFHRHPTGFGTGYFGLWAENPDGTGLAAIDVGSGSNEYPAIMSAPTTTTTQPGTSSSGSQQQTTGKTTDSTTSSVSASQTKTSTSSGTVTSNPTRTSAGLSSTASATGTTAKTAKKSSKADTKNGLFILAIILDLILIGGLVIVLFRKRSALPWLKH